MSFSGFTLSNFITNFDINTITNMSNKYFYFFLIAILVLILVLFYYLSDKQNIFKIKNTKYEIVTWLVLLAFCIYTFQLYYNRNKITPSDEKKFSFKPDDSFLQYYKNIGLLFLIILVPLFTISFILYLHKTNNDIFSITYTILGLLIAIVIFAIIAKLFSIKHPVTNKGEHVKTPEPSAFQKIITLLKDIIFFIPCLLIILVDEINKDIKLTPSSIYLLFIILLILITLIFLVPVIFTYLAKHNKNDVLSGEGPFYLNEKKTLGKYQNLDKNVANNIAIPKVDLSFNVNIKPLEQKFNNILSIFNSSSENTSTENTSSENTSNENVVKTEYIKTNDAIADNTKGYDFKLFENDLNGQYNIGAKYNNFSKTFNKFPYNYTYSISFYIYINPQPTNTSIAYTKDTELFNYGFKPVIYYNGKSRKIIIKSRTLHNNADQLDTIYEMTNVKHQKWLYFVINYENNIIDVFIDGKLVGSKKNVTPYFVGDKVTIGEDDGIYGSIKEIFYYDKIKTPDSIQFLYNLTKNKNI